MYKILTFQFDKKLGLDDASEIFKSNQSLLKSFFGNLKSADEYIRFAFLTGVARFSKVSIFSDLNHLQDISLDDRFADICGWTEKELIDSFKCKHTVTHVLQVPGKAVTLPAKKIC